MRKLFFYSLLAFLLLITLGVWQLQRLEWKNSIQAQIDNNLNKPSVSLPVNIDVDSDQYKKYELTGKFINKEIHLFSGPVKFKGKAGYNIFSPLKLDNDRIVLVDRGWIESDKKNDKRQISNIANIRGTLHKSEKKKFFTPSNNPDKNLWLWIDLNKISKKLGYDFKYYIKAYEGNDLFFTKEPVEKIKNDHLQYAITWFSLAITLVIVLIIYIRKNRE